MNEPMANDARLSNLPASFLDRVRAMPRTYDQFVELVDVLIDCNSRLRDPASRYSRAQRVLTALSRLDVQVQNGGLLQFFWNSPQWVEHVHPALIAIGAEELAKIFKRAVVQLAGNIDAFIEARRSDTVDGYLEAVSENDFDWFDDAYFGEFDRTTNRWSGLVEGMYCRTVAYVLGNIDEFGAEIDEHA